MDLGCSKLILCLTQPARVGFGEIFVLKKKKQTNPDFIKSFQFVFLFSDRILYPVQGEKRAKNRLHEEKWVSIQLLKLKKRLKIKETFKNGLN